MEEDKVCWICLSTSDTQSQLVGENVGNTPVIQHRIWVNPCMCRGSLKYVHEKCLLKWISAKTGQGARAKCPACNYVYIVECEKSLYLKTIEFFDSMLYSPSIYMNMATLYMSIYALVSLYGLDFFMIIYGLEETFERLISSNWDWETLIYIPIIPLPLLMVIRSKRSSPNNSIVRQTNAVQRISLSRVLFLMPVANLVYNNIIHLIRINVFRLLEYYNDDIIFPLHCPPNIDAHIYNEIREMEKKHSLTKFFLSAVFFPAGRCIIGKVIQKFGVFNKSIIYTVSISILGGLVSIALNDYLSILYLKQLRDSILSRKVKNCIE